MQTTCSKKQNKTPKKISNELNFINHNSLLTNLSFRDLSELTDRSVRTVNLQTNIKIKNNCNPQALHNVFLLESLRQVGLVVALQLKQAIKV
jgi:hypothetical protein